MPCIDRRYICINRGCLALIEKIPALIEIFLHLLWYSYINNECSVLIEDTMCITRTPSIKRGCPVLIVDAPLLIEDAFTLIKNMPALIEDTHILIHYMH